MLAAVRNSAARNGRVCLGLQHERSFSDAVASKITPSTHLDVKYNGRQSVSGVTATVFGCNGFVGRYVVSRLGRIGSQVVLPYRGDGMNTRHLKTMGDLGQMVFLPMDLTDEDSIRNAVKRSNVVINLVGAAHETVNYSYDDVHVKCTHRIAKICKEAGGVQRFIHVSAAGANLNANSKFLKSKAEGEQVVKDFFPDATIIRPCIIYGDEDKFLNRTAEIINMLPLVPLVGDGEQKMQPIYVQDVAQGIINAMVNSDAPGKTYTLGGPDVYTKREIVSFVSDKINRPECSVVEMPTSIAKLYARAISFLPASWRLVSPDDVDQCVDGDNLVNKRDLTCEDLGFTPTPMTQDGPTGLIRHRGQRDPKNNQFENPKGFGKIEAF